jgi:hypothetical protein
MEGDCKLTQNNERNRMKLSTILLIKMQQCLGKLTCLSKHFQPHPLHIILSLEKHEPHKTRKNTSNWKFVTSQHPFMTHLTSLNTFEKHVKNIVQSVQSILIANTYSMMVLYEIPEMFCDLSCPTWEAICFIQSSLVNQCKTCSPTWNGEWMKNIYNQNFFTFHLVKVIYQHFTILTNAQHNNLSQTSMLK